MPSNPSVTFKRCLCGLLTWLLVCLFLSACSENKPATLGPDGVILAFGDSLTAGVGTDLSSNYPAILSELTGLRVVNAGVSGETTRQGLERLPSILKAENPDLVILLEGGNDILRNLSLEKAQNNLSRMIELIQAHGAQVVLIGVPEKKLFSTMASIYPELAQAYDVVLDDGIISRLLKEPEYKSDRVHFNALGYYVLAEEIEALLKQNSVLAR